MIVSLAQQIEEVELELSFRREVYPRLVAARKKKKSTAEYQITRMEAVLRTLLTFKKHETAIRAAIEAEKAKEKAA
ncbi:MAG: hypothetical protein ACRECF_10125 [Methyloceanibacter sp.]